MENKRIYSRVFRMLARRSYSEQEMRERLKGSASDSEIEEVLDECRSRRYLDDGRLADSIAEKYLAKGKGIFYIASILEKKGISGDIVERVKENFDYDMEFRAAEDFFLKNRKRRGISSLLFSMKSRGFSFRTINKLMSRYGKRGEWTAER